MSSIFESTNGNVNAVRDGGVSPDDSDGDSSEEDVTWIAWFISLRGRI